MARLLLSRLVWFIPLLLLANLFGFAYATFARARSGVSLFFVNSNEQLSLWGTYLDYLNRLFVDGGGEVNSAGQTFWQQLAQAMVNSLGLFVLAFLVSLLLGFLLGMGAVRTQPPRIASWLTFLATLGLATPSYVIGTFGIVAILAWLVWGPGTSAPLPIKGFGWDTHLVLPVIALAIRPASQLAQLIAGLMVDELRQPYITAARGKGLDDGRVRWRHAFANIRAPIVQSIAGSLRLLIGELILIEALFNWPGLGQVLAETLIPSGVVGAVHQVSGGFLHPPLVATLATLLAAIFVLVDGFAAALVYFVDPRQRSA